MFSFIVLDFFATIGFGLDVNCGPDMLLEPPSFGSSFRRSESGDVDLGLLICRGGACTLVIGFASGKVYVLLGSTGAQPLPLPPFGVFVTVFKLLLLFFGLAQDDESPFGAVVVVVVVDVVVVVEVTFGVDVFDFAKPFFVYEPLVAPAATIADIQDSMSLSEVP